MFKLLNIICKALVIFGALGFIISIFTFPETGFFNLIFYFVFSLIAIILSNFIKTKKKNVSKNNREKNNDIPHETIINMEETEKYDNSKIIDENNDMLQAEDNNEDNLHKLETNNNNIQTIEDKNVDVIQTTENENDNSQILEIENIDIENIENKECNNQENTSINETSKVTPTSTTCTFPDVYAVLDIETPNKNNNSICQLGLSIIEHGELIKDYSTLINPQSNFDYINTKINNIDNSMVLKAPVFNEYWNVIKDIFNKYVIVSHNAMFDLTVLAKTLHNYDITVPKIKYICTLTEYQNKYPEIKKYNLSSLCDYFSISFENVHNAKYDCKMVVSLFEKLKDEKIALIPNEFSYTFIEPEKEIKPQNIPDYPQEVELNFDEVNEIDFNSKFVLTGTFYYMSRNEITNKIELLGGKITSAVSRKTNYLIVGTYEESNWKYGSYGTKIEKALELRKTTGIKIIKEEDFINFI